MLNKVLKIDFRKNKKKKMIHVYFEIDNKHYGCVEIDKKLTIKDLKAVIGAYMVKNYNLDIIFNIYDYSLYYSYLEYKNRDKIEDTFINNESSVILFS